MSFDSAEEGAEELSLTVVQSLRSDLDTRGSGREYGLED